MADNSQDDADVETLRKVVHVDDRVGLVHDVVERIILPKKFATSSLPGI